MDEQKQNKKQIIFVTLDESEGIPLSGENNKIVVFLSRKN